MEREKGSGERRGCGGRPAGEGISVVHDTICAVLLVAWQQIEGAGDGDEAEAGCVVDGMRRMERLGDAASAACKRTGRRASAGEQGVERRAAR